VTKSGPILSAFFTLGLKTTLPKSMGNYGAMKSANVHLGETTLG